MPDTLPRIAILSWEPDAQPRSGATLFNSVDALLAEPAFDVLLLDLPSADAGQALRRLRRTEAYYFSLIYCTREPNAWAQALADGKAPSSLAALEPLWRAWHERLTLFNRGRVPERLESRVLAWLWLLAVPWAHAMHGQVLVWGVFDNLGEGRTTRQYAPLVDHLNSQLQHERIELKVLSQQDLEDAIASRSLALVTTTSTHFLNLRARWPLAGFAEPHRHVVPYRSVRLGCRPTMPSSPRHTAAVAAWPPSRVGNPLFLALTALCGRDGGGSAPAEICLCWCRQEGSLAALRLFLLTPRRRSGALKLPA